MVEIIRNDKSLTLYSRANGESGSRNKGASETGGPGRVKKLRTIMSVAVEWTLARKVILGNSRYPGRGKGLTRR